MKPKEAMEELIAQGISKYKIAKVMEMQPIMVDKFLKEYQKTMRREAAKGLKDTLYVEIDDNCINGYQKQMFVDKYNNLSHN